MSITDNPWVKGGKYYPNWIEEDKEFFRQNTEYVTGKRISSPISEKNTEALSLKYKFTFR